MTNSPHKNKGLGRGLNALFDDDEGDDLAVVLGADPESSVGGGTLGAHTLGVEQLIPGTMQPRMDFEQDTLAELADSIRVHGVLQPLLVRPKRDLITGEVPDPNVYEIIAGERRWRAAQLAQLHEVPVLVRNLDDDQAMQIALIENLQREDLNPVEESLAYQRLMDEHDYTQAKLAELLGRSRSHIANMVRMLTLPEAVLEAVRAGDLTPGHARAIITTRSPEKFAEKIIAEGMSVREAERYVNAALDRPSKSRARSTVKTNIPTEDVFQKDADTLAIEEELSKAFGMKFQIQSKNPAKGGYLRLDFKNLDQLNDALGALQRALTMSPEELRLADEALLQKEQELAALEQEKARLLD